MNSSSINHGLIKKPEIMHESSKLADQRKQDKLQWLQEPSQIKGHNLDMVRYETIRNFRNKNGLHVKGKINVLEKKKRKQTLDFCRGIHECNKGSQPCIYFVFLIYLYK